MAPSAAQKGRLIELLAYQPRHIMNGMIKPDKTATPTSITRRPADSASLGRLDYLPLELLHRISGLLDFQSLSRISRTCLRGKDVIYSVPEYRDMIRHAPQVLAALGQTLLIRYHSAMAVHAILLSATCVSCGDYGPFCFLPTLERCCFECLWRNQSLWVVPISTAARCFDMPTSVVECTPVTRSLPGQYYVRHYVSHHTPTEFVSVRAVKQLAIEAHEGEGHMAQMLQAKRNSGLHGRDYRMYKWLQAAPMEPPGRQLALRPGLANKPVDNHCGMASIPFLSPSTQDGLEVGNWCRGCEETYRRWSRSPNKPLPDGLIDYLPQGADIGERLHTMQQVARSRTSFLEHIAHCPGARRLLANTRDGYATG